MHVENSEFGCKSGRLNYQGSQPVFALSFIVQFSCTGAAKMLGVLEGGLAWI